MKAETFFKSKWGIILSAGGATFLWGSSFPFIKLSYNMLEIQPNEIGEQILFASYRFIIASILILFFIYIKDKVICFKKENLKALLGIGFFQTFLQYILFYVGLSLSTGVQGAIIAGTASFFQILFAHFMYKDDLLNSRKVLGLLIGFTGVIFVNITKGSFNFNFGLGEILLLIAMMSSAFGNILARNGTAKINVANLTAFQMLLGSFGLLFIGIFTAGIFPFTFTTITFVIMIYLSLISAVGFILWNYLMKFNKVGDVSIFLFLIPVFGVILSSLFLNEIIHFFVIVGLVLVATGILVVNKKE